MSDDTSAILSRMREQRRGAAPEADKSCINPEDFYVKLVIVKHRRHQLALYTLLLFFAILAIVMRDIHIAKPWLLTALPIFGLGLLTVLIPASEIWEYKPWQTKARQYERHQVEHGQPRSL